jgi:Ser/Thr protein kinase RdoA (MazF antagonist)
MHHEQPADAFTLLTTDPPELSEAYAAELLRENYGLEGTLTLQYSERDQNFLVHTNSGAEHVLKIANSAEIAAITDFQIAALLHLEKSHPCVRVPRVIRTVDGNTSIRVSAQDGRSHTARVLSWIPGTLLEFEDLGNDVVAKMGAALASLGNALRDFEHPASDYPLLWDIKQAGKLLTLLDKVADTALRDVLRQHLEVFVTDVQPRLHDLRCQVIHNDLNPGNVVFNPDNPSEVAGIIDFGDMIRSPLVVDVAVASAYLCESSDAPFDNVFEFVRGYHEVTPLLADEFELLPYMITIRNLTSLIITHWRASRYPENRTDLLRSDDRSSQMITTLGQHQPSDISRDLQEYCDHKK